MGSETGKSADAVRSVLRKVYVCYFLSGALGLIYQILWLRKLLLVFGSTVHAVSAVLTVFFGGLALGSWLFGRLIDRREEAGLRWYGLLEAGVGVYAFATLPLFRAIQNVYIPIYQASGMSPSVLVGASLLCAAGILLIPTVLLGGTFPVLSRFLIRSSRERGVGIAGLYGINTAGALAGTLLVYHVGLPILGLLRTLLCAGVLNIGIGLICILFDRHLRDLGFRAAGGSPAADIAASREASPQALRWLLLAFGLSGFSAMVYEVAWTRALSLVLGSSIYAFCMMLATFLGGIAAGSFWVRRELRGEPATLARFVRIEWLLAAYGILSVFFFSSLPELFVRLWPLFRGSFASLSWLQAALCALVMLPPTLLMGVLFPVVSDLVTRRFAQLGQRLGTAYAINTLGGIAGSFLSGFFLIPLCGLPWAIIAAAFVNLVAGLIVYARAEAPGASTGARRLVPLSAVAAAAALTMIVMPLWQRQVLAAGVYLNPELYQGASVEQRMAGTKLLYYRDSLNATVSVHQQGPTIFLKVGGKTDASNGVDMGTQVLSAHIPLLLHGSAARVLVIGLGSGVTLGHAGRHPVSTLHCAEIEPAVIEGARHFAAYNYHVHEDPRVTLFEADGRNFLLASRQPYDVIISEPSNPWMAGLGYLFTQEFYQLAKQRLARGGVMCQWLQLYRMFPGDVKLMLRTFHEEFPHMSVWSTIAGDLLLIGSMEPHQLTYDQLAQRMALPPIRDALKVVNIDRPEVLLSLFWLGTRQIEELTADVDWLHQDDQPWVEFSAPKALYVAQTLSANYEGLERFRGLPRDLVPDYDPARENASFHEALGTLWRFREQRTSAQRAFERAVALDAGAVGAWMQLAEIYLEAQQPFKARHALEQVLRVDPARAQAHRLLARMAWYQREWDEAQRFYQRAADLQPGAEGLSEEVAACLKDAERFPLASEYYRAAISHGAGSRRQTVLGYAQTLRELKEWGAAEQLLRFAVSQFPEEAAFPLLLGQTLLDRGLAAEAQPFIERALRAGGPAVPDAQYEMARIAREQQQPLRAAQHLKRGLRVDPYHRKSLELLRWMAHEQ